MGRSYAFVTVEEGMSEAFGRKSIGKVGKWGGPMLLG